MAAGLLCLMAALASAGDLRDLSRELQLAWGIAGDYFVVASEVRHLRAIRSAVLAGPAVAGPTREGLDRRVAQGPWLSLEARVSKLAGLATQWLDYAARNHPEVLGDEGWARLLARRQRQRVELGAALRPEPNQPGKVRVVGTFRGWPAEGVLRADDLIVGLQGRLLALEDPLGDLRAALAGRAGDTVTLRVERGGRFGDVEVRLYRTAATSAPGENPLLAMEPLLSLAGAIEGLHLSVTPSSTLLCAEMELRFAAVPTVTTISPTSE